MELARLDAAKDDVRGALERLQKTVSARADFYPAWRLMGELYVDARDNVRAEQCFRQAQTLRPDDPDVQGTLGDVLMRQGRFEEALNCFDRTLKLDPTRIRAHGFRADCLERLHRLDEARDAIEQALALDPDQPEVRVHQAGLAQRSGDYVQAREILESVARRDDLYDDLKSSAHQQLGVVLDRLDDAARKKTPNERRAHERLKYRASDIALIIVHPGGTMSRVVARARNVSAGGIAVLHSGYLHPGSEVSIILRRRDMRTQKPHSTACVTSRTANDSRSAKGTSRDTRTRSPSSSRI